MLVLKNARLIDGNGGMPVDGVTILIEGNKIKDIGKGIAYPHDSSVIDVKGKSVLPGLMDMHVHMGESADFLGFGGRTKTKNYANIREYTLLNGVTTIRSCGDYMVDSINLRNEINEGKTRGPRLFCSGPSFQARNGHPSTTVWHSDPEVLAQAAAFADTPQEARDKVDEMARAGADFIKIIVGNVDVAHYPNTLPSLKPEVIQAIIEAAHDHGLSVIAHCENTKDALMVVKMGIDGIEHLVQVGSTPYEMADGLLEEMLSRKVFLTPTSYLIKQYDVLAEGKGGIELFDIACGFFKQAYDAGITICTGTDSGAPLLYHGKATLHELETLATDVGMKPMDAILAATKNSAAYVRRSSDLGTLEAGKLADILIVDGKPDEMIRDIENTLLVVKDGRIVTDNFISL